MSYQPTLNQQTRQHVTFQHRPPTLAKTGNRYALLNDTYAGAVRRQPQKKKGGQPYIDKGSHQWAEVHCYTVEEAQRYAERVLPGANLQYIPKRERNDQNWIGPNEYLDPKRGLLTWCHGGAPRTRGALMRTKMVDRRRSCQGCQTKRRTSSPEAAKEAEIGDWNVEARAHALLEDWKELPAAPYTGLLEATLMEEMYVLIMRKEANMADFKRWLEVRPPEGDGRKSLASSMETLIIRDEIQEDVTTTKADIDQESHFDFEEWEKQGKTNELEEAMTEDMVPLLEELETRNE
ncbi:hypothetical protein RhiJN_05889 [Ceratobasidium sp. AG-Ba]|nr:hypothetical protein RhiJN_05889 [Ceratobasidium sp. AG-Ba]